MHPPPKPSRANFTLMTECTPESSSCYSVYSVLTTFGRAPSRSLNKVCYIQYIPCAVVPPFNIRVLWVGIWVTYKNALILITMPIYFPSGSIILKKSISSVNYYVCHLFNDLTTININLVYLFYLLADLASHWQLLY